MKKYLSRHRYQAVIFILTTISRNNLPLKMTKTLFFTIYIKDMNVKRLRVIVAHDHVGLLLREVLTAHNFQLGIIGVPCAYSSVRF